MSNVAKEIVFQDDLVLQGALELVVKAQFVRDRVIDHLEEHEVENLDHSVVINLQQARDIIIELIDYMQSHR